ncbi:FtsX-like permease family protein [Desulfocurvibacter africanus]|uniref:FtsX-like permease family protein n=1 Tax=Desulfocurvibacter africanus TaxID=873 RepID=UPI000550DAA0|nr:FtsX-like permease family protein [Desulfocurvibacter africanus]
MTLRGFFTLQARFGLRHLRRSFWRTLAVVLGIGLGAAVFTSVRLAVDASLESFTRSMDLLAGQAELSVSMPGGRLDDDLVARLATEHGIIVAPVLTAWVNATKITATPDTIDDTEQPTNEQRGSRGAPYPENGPGGWGLGRSEPLWQAKPSPALTQPTPGETFRLVGLDPLLDASLRDLGEAEPEAVGGSRGGGDDSGDDGGGGLTMDVRVWRRLMVEPWSLALSSRLAERLGLREGDGLELTYAGRTARMKVVALLSDEGLAMADGGLIALADLATVQELTGLLGLVDRIDLRLTHGATEADVRALLPPGAVLGPPSAERESGQAMIGAYRLNLTVLGFVSLFVGMFLVYSLVAVAAASRRRELAILRSLGASRRVLMLLFLAEGGLLGLLGWLASLPMSFVLMPRLLRAVNATISTLFTRVNVDSLSVSPTEALLSLTVTVGVSVAAALQPAREARAVPPREALTMAGIHGRAAPVHGPALIGLLLIALAWPISLLPSPEAFPLPGYAAIFLLFAGFTLLCPWLVRIVSSLALPFVSRLGGAPGLLAGRAVSQADARTALSVGALVTATALFLALSIMVQSFRSTFTLWLEQTVSGDLFVRPALSDANDYRTPLPPDALAWIEAHKAEAANLPYLRIAVSLDGAPYQLEIMDLEVLVQRGLGSFLFLRGDPRRALELTGQGRGVLVSEVLANRTGLGLGERYRDTVAGVSLDEEIVGIIRCYRTRGGVVYLTDSRWRELGGEFAPNGVRMWFPVPDPEARARAFRQAILSSPVGFGLEASVGGELRREIARIFDQTFAVTTVLLLVALAVAALGIAGALTVMVLERSREVRTMLALGGSRGQVRAMILWEACLLVTAGLAAGTACGFLLSAILIYVVNRVSFGWTFLYSVDWLALALGLPLIFLACLAAGLPALRIAASGPPAAVLRER